MKLVDPSVLAYFLAFLYWSRYINEAQAGVFGPTVSIISKLGIPFLTFLIFNPHRHNSILVRLVKSHFVSPHYRLGNGEQFVNVFLISLKLFLIYNFPVDNTYFWTNSLFFTLYCGIALIA